MKVILQRWNLRKGRRFKIQKVHTVLCYHGDHASWKQVGWETSIQNISRKMHTSVQTVYSVHSPTIGVPVLFYVTQMKD